MADEELIDFCRGLYAKDGIGALAYEALKAHRTLYTTLYHRGLRQSVLLQRLGLMEEYRAWKAVQPVKCGSDTRERWTWDRVLKDARAAQRSQGFLPPAAWWQATGHGSLVQAVYLLGRTWEQLRVELEDFQSSQFVESRSGLRWRSHAEASLSNFLYARAIPHRRGSRYPKSYEELTGRAYGLYDLHFDGQRGSVDIEVWGDNPNGAGRHHYQAKREGKELFNTGNPSFLGIHFMDCYGEEKLVSILEPQIGLIEPFCFDRPTDRVIPSTHWSNADELLEYCRIFAASQPNGEFPTEEWLRKRGKWSQRPGHSYNTLSIYVKTWLGGVRKLRELLGQAHVSTVKWDREKVLERRKAFRELHSITPNAMRARSQRGQATYSAAALEEACRLASVVSKYVGGSATADQATGFKPNRKKPRSYASGQSIV
jgi:hypothetical protein